MNGHALWSVTILAMMCCAAFSMVPSQEATFTHVTTAPRLGLSSTPTMSTEEGLPVSLARSSTNYDVQLGMTFTQSFSSLAYNVTAVAQSDANGYGPGYLLNGLSDQGYWCQVGISWDWPYTNGGYTSGFNMNYEVFDRSGNSVFPTSGGGGLTGLSGRVNGGDIVLLRLYFSGGNVVMYVFDWNTSASAQMTYTAHGATTFVGQTGGPDNGSGFFTGLMTEWWHATSSLGVLAPVIYSSSDVSLSSAWLWADQWNPTTGKGIFSDYRYVSFASPSGLQVFSTNGTTMAANGYEFVTGEVPQVQLTLAYLILGGGSGYSPPILSYWSNGAQLTQALSLTPSAYYLDAGTSWSVSQLLPGSTSGERWSSEAQSSGVAALPATLTFTYYHQLAFLASYVVTDNSNPVAPSLSATAFGAAYAPSLTQSAASYWLDFGTGWNLENPLSGTGPSERWISLDVASGSVSSATTLLFTFLHQYYVVIQASAAGGGSLTPSGWYNVTSSVSISATPGSGWGFGGWQGVGSGSYSGSEVSPSITVGSAIVENATFDPGLTIDVGANGRVICSYGSVSFTIDSGTKTIYVPLGTNVSIAASPSSFLYQFDGFEYEHSGLGPWTVSGVRDTASATVDVPSTVRATFGFDYVKLAAIVGVIAAAAAVSVLILLRHRVRAAARPDLSQSGDSVP